MSNQPPPIDLPPIQFIAAGDDDEMMKANLDAVLPSPGYPAAAIMIAEAISKRADLIVLDYSAQSVKIRFQIDGVWHELPPRDRASGDYMLASLKKLANLNYLERRGRQEGIFAAKLMNQKTEFNFISQGVPTGERVVIHVNREKPPTETLEDLGMRQKMIDEIKEHFAKPSGLVLVSTLPGDGHSTFWRGALNAFDRYMRDYYSVEEASRLEAEVINVNPVTFDEAAGQTAKDVTADLLLREPDVLAFPEIPTGELLDHYCDIVLDKGKLVIARIPAKSSVEAILRAIALKPTVSKFAEALHCVIYQRTIRKLCQRCREAYSPSPQLLQKMGLSPGRVQTFYNDTQPPPPEECVDEQGRPIEIEICPKCSGLGFLERSGIFEYLNVTDRFRKAMKTTTDIQSLLGVGRSEGHLTLREEGVVLVAKGVTSVQELQRVLKK
ncbi:MAG: ATPase, T2SS/T4P/T4SS family [Planctomycetota bacterium]|nr:ATPase, T2SS/T4P/T4SS family [Planctomycetota bacterium]